MPGVGFERDDRQRHIKFRGMRRSLADHRLVTEVNSIEITDGDRRIPNEIGQAGNVSEYAHSGGLRNYRRRASQTIPCPIVRGKSGFISSVGDPEGGSTVDYDLFANRTDRFAGHVIRIRVDLLDRDPGLNRVADTHGGAEIQVLV